MTTTRKSDDPDQLLNCDPAAVAMRASQSYETLQKLKEFAKQLTKYVGLMEDAKVVDLSQDDDDDIDDPLVVDRSTPSAVVAGRPASQLTMVPRRRGKSHTTTNIRETTTSSAETGSSRREKRKASQKRDRQEARRPTEMARKSQPPANPTTDADSPKAAARSVRARSQVAMAITPSPRRQKREPLRMEGDDDDEDYQPDERIGCETVVSSDSITPPPTKAARRITTTETTTPSPLAPEQELEERLNWACKEQRIQKQPSHLAPEHELEENRKKACAHRLPRHLPPGSKGDLKSSQLQRSVGKTRKVLNEHLELLGLTAKFGMGVVSKQGNRVSHLTLNNAWNHLPQNRDETLEYWLGEGTQRLTLVSPLDPSIQKQPEKGCPIFWACDTKHGGALCYYVGHFRCIGLTKTDAPIMMLKNARQALIEFEFIKFDMDLAARISTTR
jgi:hypothetical protein